MNPQKRLKEIEDKFEPTPGPNNSISFRIELEDIAWLIARIKTLEAALKYFDNYFQDAYGEMEEFNPGMVARKALEKIK